MLNNKKHTKKAPSSRGLKDLGSDLLSHMKVCSIIGDEELNFRVRNGFECTLFSLAAKNMYCIGAKKVLLLRKQDVRAISTGQLHVSLRFHLQPIYEVVSLGPSRDCSRENLS